jgi:hypothetical protein
MDAQVIERRALMPLNGYLISLQTWTWEVPDHPAYIPDLAPFYFHLF